MFIQMDVEELLLTFDEAIVVLKDAAGERSLPLWIGRHDAAAIVAGIKKIQFPRPLAHDVLTNLLKRLDVSVERVEICDLRENVYFALIHLRKNDEAIAIDARPMDAIAIAVRTNAPIFVREEVLAKSPVADLSGQPVFNKMNRERCTDVLADLDLNDFGKYKM
jgi:hypothetical protein